MTVHSRGLMILAIAAIALGARPAAAESKPKTPAAADASPSTTAPARRLALVGRTKENTIYIDKPTLRKLTNDKYELWAQVRQAGGDTVKLLLQVNCSDRSYLVKSMATYSEDGTVLDSDTPRSPTLQYIVPDSAAEYIHQAICRKS